ncbi:AAA domain-containing protein [Actinokineospora enzanensis]|uniref:AAA domain-containing protein n=1 Tax=Actinokineospora enzanensis TaxID=155975 RepID=UPI000363AAAB|nr:AAA domain-containing protein [Actinokineospora enzanensis]
MSPREAVAGMRAALTAEITSLRRADDASAPTARLVSARTTGGDPTGRYYLARVTAWPTDLPRDSALVARAGTRGPWHPVTGVEVTGRDARFSCPVDLGAEPPVVFLRADPARSAIALREAIGDVLGRGKADLVLGARAKTAVSTEAARLTTEFGKLNLSQQSAVARALAGDITFIWGPPGTGKTDVVARIVEGSLRQGRSVLFVAPTHVAVDQALERVCDLVHDLPDFADGLVRRVGEAQVSSLVGRYGDVIDPDQVVARLGAGISTRVAELREQQRVVTGMLHDREAADAARAAVQAAVAALGRHHARRADIVRYLTTVDGQVAGLDRQLDALEKQRFFTERRAERTRAERAELARQRVVPLRDLTAVDAAIATTQRDLTRLHTEADAAVHRAGITDAATLRARAAAIADELTQATATLAELPKRVQANCRLAAMTTQRGYQGGLPFSPQVVVVDEAGMVDLPTAVFLASRASERVVFAGDFRQLPAVVTGETDRQATEEQRATVRHWLSRDAFRASGVIGPNGEVREDPRLARLGTQYRMRPGICAVVNAVAYPDAPLRTGRSDVSSVVRSPVLSGPLVLIDTSGRAGLAGTAYRNEVHAALIREYVRLLQHDGVLPARGDDRVDPKSVLAVIAPYRKQVKLLDGHLTERLGKQFTGLVDTVHRFQGSQRPVVVIDTVSGASRRLGVFYEGVGPDSTTCRLLNVALSRAQDHVVVVADVAHLRERLPAGSEVRVMLDHLTAHARHVPLDDLIPVRTAAELGDLAADDLARPAFFPADEVDAAVLWDFARAARRIEIYCPFLHSRRMPRFRPALLAALARGTAVRLFTRGADEHPDHEPILRALAADGFAVETRDQMHEKMVVVDDVLWHGSLNLFADTRATELMMRLASPVACEAARVTVHRAQPTRPRRGLPAGARVYLKVPFAEKEEAKKVGARWDGARRQWYVDGANATAVTRWGD